MHAKVLQDAAGGGRTVALLELELDPKRSLFVVVLDLPADSRGRRQHWCRTEADCGDALELYEQAVRDHVTPAAE